MTKRLRRFEPRLNAGGGVASIVVPFSTARVVNVAESLFTNRAGAVSPPYSAPSGRSVEKGGLAPSPQKLIPLPPRSDRRERSREGIQRPHGSQTGSPPRLLPWRSKWIVRCSPRLRRRSSVVRKSEVFVITKDEVFRTTTRSVHRRLWPSVEAVGVGHSEPPVKGSAWGVWSRPQNASRSDGPHETPASRGRYVHVGCTLRHRTRKPHPQQARGQQPRAR